MHRGSVKSLEGRSSKSWLRNRGSSQKKWKDDSYVSSIVRKMESPEEVRRRKSGDELIDGKKTLRNDKSISELLDRYSKEIDDHFFVVEEEVMTAVEEERKDSEDEKVKMTAVINEDAEREMEEIRKRRDERLKQNEEKCEKTCKVVEEQQQALLMELHNLGQNVRESMEKLKTKHYGSSAAKANANIDQLLSKFDNNGEAEKPAHDGVRSSTGLVGLADQVSGIANSVTFTRVKGEHVGQINGEKDRWVLEEEIKLGPIELPVLKGSITEEEVVIEDIKTSTVYVTNIKHKTTREVLKKPLFNCASQDGQIIVCGTREGHVALYDKSWKHIRSLRLPDKFRSGAKVMCVAVDDSGKILVAQYGSNHIHVYHPSGSQWLRTLDIDESVPIHGIHVLPSGIAVHSAMYGEQVYLLDKDGNRKATAFLEESESKCLSILAAHHGTDSLYNLFCESASGKCVIEEVLDVSSGKARIEKILEFPAPPIANGLIGVEGFSVLQPDKMVTCDGEKVLIYRKRLGVGHLGNVVS